MPYKNDMRTFNFIYYFSSGRKCGEKEWEMGKQNKRKIMLGKGSISTSNSINNLIISSDFVTLYLSACTQGYSWMVGWVYLRMGVCLLVCCTLRSSFYSALFYYLLLTCSSHLWAFGNESLFFQGWNHKN